MAHQRLSVIGDLPPGRARAQGRQPHVIDGVPTNLMTIRRQFGELRPVQVAPHPNGAAVDEKGRTHRVFSRIERTAYWSKLPSSKFNETIKGSPGNG